MPQIEYSGKIAPHDELHQTINVSDASGPFATCIIAPNKVKVDITHPNKKEIWVQQYSKTVKGSSGHDPANDCNGNFTSSRFQPNNNCYAYACAIATNTFPQPGRRAGWSMEEYPSQGLRVQDFAEKDGLIDAGRTWGDMKNFVAAKKLTFQEGHIVALLYSEPQNETKWEGDYHWVRCDDHTYFSSWSHKVGRDTVTQRDFAGRLITDPMKADWTMNKGPQNDGNDLVVEYDFVTFMWVWRGRVDII